MGDRRWHLVLLVVLAVAGMLWRAQPVPAEAGVVVEVVGGTMGSGLRRVPVGATTGDVARSLGVASRAAEPVTEGDRVRLLADGHVHIERGEPLLFGRRVDPNHDDLQALMHLPGVGASLARRIRSGGPHATPHSLDDVSGVGPMLLERILPLIEVHDPPEPPAPPAPPSFNDLDESGLIALSGIGPVLAGRILDDRAANGPVVSITALERVHGIGPSTAARIASQVVFE